MIRRNLCAMVFLALSCFAGFHAVANEDDDRNADAGGESAENVFRSNYKIALSRMEAYFGEVIAIGRLTITRIPSTGDRTASSFAMRFQFSGGASKWEQEPLGGALGSSAIVWCRNPKHYVFSIERPISSELFKINRLASGDSDRSKPMDETIYRQFRASHAINGVLFSTMMDDASFSVQSAQYVQEGSDNLVHVKYDYSPEDDEQMLRGGELWLNPARGWAIDKCRSDYFVEDRPSTPASMTCKIEYDSFEDGVAIPGRVLIEQRLGGFRIEEELVIEEFTHGPSSLSEFTLPHYGLPEIDPKTFNKPVARQRSTIFLALNGAFIVALIVVILWRRRAKRI